MWSYTKLLKQLPLPLWSFHNSWQNIRGKLYFPFLEISLASSVKISFQVWPWADGINGGRGCATMFLLWCPRYKANPTNGYITSIGFVKLHHVTTYFASWQRWYSKDIDNFFTYKLLLVRYVLYQKLAWSKFSGSILKSKIN